MASKGKGEAKVDKKTLRLQAKKDKAQRKKKAAQLSKKIPLKTDGEIHITIVGDRGTSKTTLLNSFAKIGEPLDGLFDVVSFQVQVEGSNRKMVLRVFDTDADELFARVRSITYKTTDVFIVCFSVNHPETFYNVRSWYAEVNQLSPQSPIILVGTKADESATKDRITKQRAAALIRDYMMLYNYVEINAKDGDKVQRLIELCIMYLDL